MIIVALECLYLNGTKLIKIVSFSFAQHLKFATFYLVTFGKKFYDLKLIKKIDFNPKLVRHHRVYYLWIVWHPYLLSKAQRDYITEFCLLKT